MTDQGAGLIATLPNVPAAALATIAAEIGKFGAFVQFDTPFSGIVESPAGKLRFLHDGKPSGVLSVFLEVDLEHFPRKLIVGGIRQTVEEAVELLPQNERKA